jgi:hypothetical protein
MIQITLTRFQVTQRGYSRYDVYKACWKTLPDDNCHPITGYMAGAAKLMKTQKNQPQAWSFGNWKSTKNVSNHKDNWNSATAIGLEYRGKDLAAKAQALHDAADELGYAHAIFNTMTRKGEATISIMFPLTETINEGQYARLAKVLMCELGVYLAADGNCAMTHLFHIHEDAQVIQYEGAVLAPKAKIKETRDLYQSKDPNEFCVGGKRAIPHLVDPIITSHDGLFTWATTPAEKAQQLEADLLLKSIGVHLPK